MIIQPTSPCVAGRPAGATLPFTFSLLPNHLHRRRRPTRHRHRPKARSYILSNGILTARIDKAAPASNFHHLRHRSNRRPGLLVPLRRQPPNRRRHHHRSKIQQRPARRNLHQGPSARAMHSVGGGPQRKRYRRYRNPLHSRPPATAVASTPIPSGITNPTTPATRHRRSPLLCQAQRLRLRLDDRRSQSQHEADHRLRLGSRHHR